MPTPMDHPPSAVLRRSGKVSPDANLYFDFSTAVQALSLFGSDGTWVGTVLVPSSVAKALDPSMYVCVRVSSTATNSDLGPDISVLMPFDRCFDLDTYRSSGTARDRIDVMLVSRENKTASRPGVGVCHVQAFERAKPKRCEIHLA